jgi:hypothetical protein
MYYHISFNTWYNYTKRCQKRERHYLKQEKLRNKCVKDGKPFVPVEYEEEKEAEIMVTIEVDEVVYYTSEENNEDDLLIEEESNAMRLQSIEKSNMDLKKSLNKRRGQMGSGGSNRVSTISGLSG